MLGILGVTGVLLTLGLVFMPWRKVGYGFRLLFDKSQAQGEGEVKPFNALMTALSATVGTGNIAGVATAIRFGVARGVFSNESGLGSAAIAHAAAQTNSPVRQGIIAMLGTFIDTLMNMEVLRVRSARRRPASIRG